MVLQDGARTYVYGLDLISATDGSGNQAYFSYDALGSVSDLTDGTGAVTDSYTYDVFGALTAQIEQIRAFSAHADRDDLARWLRTMPGRPRRVFVVHGEHHVSLAFRERLAALTGWDVAVPAYGETVDLSG